MCVFGGGSSELGQASNDLGLNAALVGATADLEEAVVTPVGVPAVGNSPVVGAVLNTPANDLDGVAAEGLARGVGVHARLVRQEVAEDGEGSLNGAVLLDLCGNLVNATHTVAGGAKVLVVGVGLLSE